jgi:MFS transporter, BCD family, chlorophyll transporter
MADERAAIRFTPARALRLSSFQIGSAMADILVASIWNRVMITNFGVPAAPVSFLLALRYLMAPLSYWAGYRSDSNLLFGYRRTSYIWLGRALMIVSLPFLGFSLMAFEAARAGAPAEGDALGWLLAILSLVLFGIGTLVSGSPFITLVRDSAEPEKQGLAISTVETALIVCFAVFGILFGTWMEVYSLQVFWQLLLVTMIAGGFFWFFAIVGIEKRSSEAMETGTASTAAHRFLETFRGIVSDPRTRGFFVFLSLATFSAWMQEAILEPFGGDVLALSTGRTTRINSYWHTATVLALLGSGFLLRKRPPEQQRTTASYGLVTMVLGMVGLAISAYSSSSSLLVPALIAFGAGFGIFTFGGLSLMAVMSPDLHAGAYIGLWTASILFFKGTGILVGGALRDLFFLVAGLPASTSYGIVFSLAAVGLGLSVTLLSRIDVIGFARDYGRQLGAPEAKIAGAD